MRAAIIVDGKVDNIIEVDALGALEGVVLVEAPTASIGDQWDGKQFVKPASGPVDMEMLKAAKNEQINAWRALANMSTFPHAGKQIACDALSRSDIDGVANNISLSGGFPAGFPMAWKATDNTFIELADVDAFKDMYTSMTAQGTENFNHAQALKALLAAAGTPEEIAAIEW
jgi:hypothetical protein